MSSSIRRLSIPILALIAGLVAGACGSRSPLAPDPTGTRGATLQGTVVTSAGTSGLSADSLSRAGIRVSVIGTSLSTTTDRSGRFVLQGVPSGRLVVTDGATVIRKDGNTIALTDVLVGDKVEVEGTTQSDGNALAKKIKVEDSEDDSTS